MSIHFGDKNVKEIRYGQKKVKEVWYGDKKVWPSGGGEYTPQGEPGDKVLYFWVKVKDPTEKFKIPVKGENSSTQYSWDISVDNGPPRTYQGSAGGNPLLIDVPLGEHVVKIVPTPGGSYQARHHGWARAMGCKYSYSGEWNNDINKLEFSLERLPASAFAANVMGYIYDFCSGLFRNAKSLIRLPAKIVPISDGSEEARNKIRGYFLKETFSGCENITYIPKTFGLRPEAIVYGQGFMYYTFHNCTNLKLDQNSTTPFVFPNVDPSDTLYYGLECFGGTCPITPDTPAPGSSVMVRRNS